jgi:hypothetical protein
VKEVTLRMTRAAEADPGFRELLADLAASRGGIYATAMANLRKGGTRDERPAGDGYDFGRRSEEGACHLPEMAPPPVAVPLGVEDRAAHGHEDVTQPRVPGVRGGRTGLLHQPPVSALQHGHVLLAPPLERR